MKKSSTDYLACFGYACYRLWQPLWQYLFSSQNATKMQNQHQKRLKQMAFYAVAAVFATFPGPFLVMGGSLLIAVYYGIYFMGKVEEQMDKPTKLDRFGADSMTLREYVLAWLHDYLCFFPSAFGVTASVALGAFQLVVWITPLDHPVKEFARMLFGFHIFNL